MWIKKTLFGETYLSRAYDRIQPNNLVFNFIFVYLINPLGTKHFFGENFFLRFAGTYFRDSLSLIYLAESYFRGKSTLIYLADFYFGIQVFLKYFADFYFSGRTILYFKKSIEILPE